ncbi:MAG TPA: glycosyltransferase [Candidatus Pristimantibacillus sp.]|nr:glycosyltransferase [Candidatus Pristimantibacillus sp.]
MKIGLVVPHIFIDKDILPSVIFSPGTLALQLAEGLQDLGAEVTLFTPDRADTTVTNVTADMSLFEIELAGRGDNYLDLLKKHPLTFVSLARQVQAELIAKAYAMANRGELDVVHIYTNEEDIALPFAEFCQKPVVFTHHDPFRLLVKYKSSFPKYRQLNWISISLAQRQQMPPDTNWVANIYHGLPEGEFAPNYEPTGNYVAYIGRIIESKGVHLAIDAAKQAGVKLKIAGKHYAGHGKDAYWHEKVEPQLGQDIEYVGFVKGKAKQDLLGNAAALLVPSTFDEPFGMVMIEALACGTPVIGLPSGAIPEVIKDGKTGFVTEDLPGAIAKINTIDRHTCRAEFEARFTLRRMCEEHLDVYGRLHDH